MGNLEPETLIDGRFQIESLAGEGGMSRVYRATDRATNELVALKILSSIDERERFVREAHVLASLQHPGIVRYVAHGAVPTPYLAMSWLEGEDLGTRLLREELTLTQTVELVGRVAEALGAAHRVGVVHRDLKPSNIFLRDRSLDQPTLIDFGVARVDSARTLTRTGTVIGTVGYMAPEQARGAAAIDARADVFALGCVLFRCLTGRAPFTGENAGVIVAKLVLSERPRVSDWISGVPAALDQIVQRTLARSPTERPANGEQLALALASLGPLHHERPVRDNRLVRPVADREQRLACLVFASYLAEHDVGDGDAATTVLPEVSNTQRQAIAAAVTAHGGTMEMFADRSLMVMISGALAATDLAVQAVRCALALRDIIPGARFVIALGHSDSSTGLPTTGSIDQLDLLMREVPTNSEIVVDDATAHLLDARFELAKLSHGAELVQARRTEIGLRPLLGKPTPCVGRDREQALMFSTLHHVIHEAVPRALVVTAVPGMGKSRLAREFEVRARTLHPQLRIWRAHADALSSGSAFALLGSAVRDAASLSAVAPDAIREAALRTWVAEYVPTSEIARVTEFLAELADIRVAQPSAQLHAARQDPTLMGDHLLRAWKELVAGACGRHPLLLILEDLHWGDHPSVRFVDATLRGSDRPLMLLALARPEVHQVFPRLWMDRGMQEIQLGGLPLRARERLVRHALGEDVEPEVIDRLAARCDGNAFYLEELIRAVAEGRGDQLPDSVLAMAEARFQRLDPACRKVLRAASVLGEIFWRGAIEALMTRDEWATAAPSIDELLEREVITASPASRFANESELAFRHALIRDAAYASMPEPDRVSAHARAGDWLEAHGERDSVALAQHFEQGGDLARARTHYKRAAEHAFDGNDLDSALARADHAVRCGATSHALGELLLLQAEVKGWHGKPAEQLPFAIQAIANLPTGALHTFRAAEQIAVAACRTANHEALQRAADSLVSLEPSGGVSGAHLWPLARTVNQLVLMGQTTHAQRLIARMEQLRARAPADDRTALACLQFARAFAAIFDLEPEAYVRDIDAIVAAFDAGGYQRYSALQYFHLIYALGALGAYEEGLARAHDTLALTQRLDLAIYAAGTKGQLGWFLALRGEFDEARRLADEGLAFSIKVGQKLMEGNVRLRLAAIHELAGDLAAAEREARTASEMKGLVSTFRSEAHGLLALVLLRAGRVPEALAASTEAMRTHFPAGNCFGTHGRIWLTHIDALAASGQRDDSLRCLRDAQVWLRERADRIVSPTNRRSFVESVREHAEILAR